MYIEVYEQVRGIRFLLATLCSIDSLAQNETHTFLLLFTTKLRLVRFSAKKLARSLRGEPHPVSGSGYGVPSAAPTAASRDCSNGRVFVPLNHVAPEIEVERQFRSNVQQFVAPKLILTKRQRMHEKFR